MRVCDLFQNFIIIDLFETIMQTLLCKAPPRIYLYVYLYMSMSLSLLHHPGQLLPVPDSWVL